MPLSAPRRLRARPWTRSALSRRNRRTTSSVRRAAPWSTRSTTTPLYHVGFRQVLRTGIGRRGEELPSVWEPGHRRCGSPSPSGRDCADAYEALLEAGHSSRRSTGTHGRRRRVPKRPTDLMSASAVERTALGGEPGRARPRASCRLQPGRYRPISSQRGPACASASARSGHAAASPLSHSSDAGFWT